MRLLVLGGTHHVGRAAVELARSRGDSVTVLNRGISRAPAPGVRALVADRTVPGALAGALDPVQGPWDVVLDTWSGAPRAVRDSARALAGRAGSYVYVSSRSVYRWPLPLGVDEGAPVVDADPGSADATDYAAAKRGAELAVLASFGTERSLLARAGLVLGPYEVTGRLPWWLGRISRGGQVLAPGPADRPLQYVDGRDLAGWLLDAGERGTCGTFNAVSRPGHATMGSLLGACRDATGSAAELVWLSPAEIGAAGLAGWTELPVWLDPDGEDAGLHDGDVSAALAAGLSCRPVGDTVADTWRWLQAEGFPPPRTDRPPLGLDPDRERAVLAARDRP
jgi:nucleoside-diphosphate-sugar epimerase